MQESLCPTPESGAFIIHTQAKKTTNTPPPETSTLVSVQSAAPTTPPSATVRPKAEPKQNSALPYANTETAPISADLTEKRPITSLIYAPSRSSLTSAQREQLAALPLGCYQLVGYEKSSKTPPYKVAYYRVSGVEKRLLLAGNTIKGVSALASNTNTPQDTRVDIFQCRP